jgi:replicative DNA helicase
MPDMGDHEKFSQWQERMDKSMNIAEVIVAKQRHGPIGTERFHFNGNVTRFSDLDTVHSI